MRSSTLRCWYLPNRVTVSGMNHSYFAKAQIGFMNAKHFYIDRTPNSPEVEVDLETGTIAFSGRSLIPNGYEFYERVYRWVDEYLKAPREETIVNLRLDYMDTGSSKHFYRIFTRLASIADHGKHVRVNWHYEIGDEAMAETGKDYEDQFALDFRFIPVSELF